MERRAEYQVEPDFAARQSILWAIAWLVGGVTVALAAQIALIKPSLAGDFTFLTYPFLKTVADTALVFGFLAVTGFAAAYAIIPRIANVQLHNEPLGAAVTLFWGVIVTGGILFALRGFNQGRPLAELAVGADIAMALLLAIVLYNVGVTVIRRREETLYVSGWFLLMAVLLAPIVFAVGNLPLFAGAMDAIVNGFYLNGLEMLWFLPVALGIAHYVVPVETGNALASGPLARISFWSLALAGGWAGQRFYLKSPAPDYLDAIAFAMTIVLLIPVLSAAANLVRTGADRWEGVSRSFGLRWAATGIVYMVGWLVLVVITTTPSINRFIGVTQWQSGVRTLAFLGVFGSFAFAFISHAYPLMVGRDWFSRGVSSFHYWTTNAGVLVTTVAFLASGAAQASGTPVEGTPDVVGALRIIAAAGFALVAIAQYALVFNTYRTSRSGPFLHPSATQVALEGAR